LNASELGRHRLHVRWVRRARYDGSIGLHIDKRDVRRLDHRLRKLGIREFSGR
jgi:hypothetical protein